MYLIEDLYHVQVVNIDLLFLLFLEKRLKNIRCRYPEKVDSFSAVHTCTIEQSVLWLVYFVYLSGLLFLMVGKNRGGGGGGGGGTWLFRGRIRSLSKFKNTPKALISGQKSTLI